MKNCASADDKHIQHKLFTVYVADKMFYCALNANVS